MRSAVVVTGTLLVCLLGGAVVAQDKPANSMDAFREKARADKKLVVASVLGLTDSEAKAFWPVYNAYQSDMVAHYDRLIKLIGTYAKAYSAMTDETATKLGFGDGSRARELSLDRDHRRRTAGDLRKEKHLAVGRDRLEEGVLVDLAVDGHRHTFVEVRPDRRM
jgi:hypothetical protein